MDSIRWDHLHDVRGNLLEQALLMLPTEAQWEYACRAGQPSGRYSGNGFLDDMAWHSGNSDIDPDPQVAALETHDVGLKLPNQFGIHDMHGNVFEWVRDIHAGGEETNFYETAEASGLDPVNEPPLACRAAVPPTCGPCSYEFCGIYRGGYYGTDPSGNPSRLTCRTAARSVNTPVAGGPTQGFRAACYPIPGR